MGSEGAAEGVDALDKGRLRRDVANESGVVSSERVARIDIGEVQESV